MFDAPALFAGMSSSAPGGIGGSRVCCAAQACVTADEASRMVNKDVCITAHVYDVVELPDGTRFLDVCAPETPDEHCRFTIVSFREDREDVGELPKYRDMNVRVRGIVRPMHGRAGMVVSHARQFDGGPPKIQAQSNAGAGIRRRAGTAADCRSESAHAGRASGIHEYQGSGGSAAELGGTRDGTLFGTSGLGVIQPFRQFQIAIHLN